MRLSEIVKNGSARTYDNATTHVLCSQSLRNHCCCRSVVKLEQRQALSCCRCACDVMAGITIYVELKSSATARRVNIDVDLPHHPTTLSLRMPRGSTTLLHAGEMQRHAHSSSLHSWLAGTFSWFVGHIELRCRPPVVDSTLPNSHTASVHARESDVPDCVVVTEAKHC